MSRRPRASSTTVAREGKVLAQLKSEEGAGVLRSLLERHPELVAEAEEIARARVTDVDRDAVAEDVQEAVLDLDIDELETRAGSKTWGYVEPTEAAWELLEEAVHPFLEEMKRDIALGFEAAAAAMCAGIVLGLYQCRDRSSDQLLGWAVDFPAETARHAVVMLARESRAKHRRGWKLPDASVDQVPEWADMIGRASKPAPRGR
ncbi:MAG TPA: hypothetical protein VKM54_22295 [Myxococcota bacterium]|nr:hypothetical protein [Myxococcota bacterium]